MYTFHHSTKTTYICTCSQQKRHLSGQVITRWTRMARPTTNSANHFAQPPSLSGRASFVLGARPPRVQRRGGEALRAPHRRRLLLRDRKDFEAGQSCIFSCTRASAQAERRQRAVRTPSQNQSRRVRQCRAGPGCEVPTARRLARRNHTNRLPIPPGTRRPT